MINSRFFIENSEVIGLWMIYSIVIFLAVCILDAIVDYIAKRRQAIKIQKNKEAKRRQAIYRDAMKWRNQQEEIRQKEFRKNFKKQYLNYVINF